MTLNSKVRAGMFRNVNEHMDESKLCFLRDDVKKFIKDIKEEINKFGIHKTGVHSGFLCLKIDELSGLVNCAEEEE